MAAGATDRRRILVVVSGLMLDGFVMRERLVVARTGARSAAALADELAASA